MNTEKIEKTIATPTTVARFDWERNNMTHRTLRCEQHPGCEWITKHAWDRSVFYVTERVTSCACPLEGLTVE